MVQTIPDYKDCVVPKFPGRAGVLLMLAKGIKLRRLVTSKSFQLVFPDSSSASVRLPIVAKYEENKIMIIFMKISMKKL